MIPGHIEQNVGNFGNVEYLDPPATPVYLETITPNHKQAIILQDELNYTYSNKVQYSRSQKVSWRCSLKSSKRCKCSVIVENDRIIVRRNFHNHEPNNQNYQKI